MIHFKPASGKWDYFPIDTSVVIADIRERPDGNLYLGSLDHGLFLFDPARRVTGHLHAGNSILNNQSTATLYLDDQEVLWINTDPEGLHVLYPERRGFLRFGKRFFEANGFRSTGIRCFTEASDGRIWVGTEEDGIFLFDPATRQVIRNYRVNGPEGLRENHASALLYDTQGRLWMGTNNGVFLAKDVRSFVRIPITSSFATVQASNHIWDILETPQGILFFATAGGLYYALPDAEQIYPLEVLHDLSTGDIELFGDWLLAPEYHRGFWAFNYRRWLESGRQERVVRHSFEEYNIKHFVPQGDSVLWLATTTGLLKLTASADQHDFTLAPALHQSGRPAQRIFVRHPFR